MPPFEPLDFLLPSLFFFFGASITAIYFQRKLSVQRTSFRIEREREELEKQEQEDQEQDSFFTQLQREREYHERRYADLQATHNQMRDQFKAVAIEEFQHQSRELQHQNKEQMELILEPLKQRLEQLDSAVSKNNIAGEKNKVFMEEISRNLMDKADKIGSDAVELARALKGNTKLQGDWGEMLLESILSYAGLNKGQEYMVQPSYANAAGEQLRPDLVIHYPQGQRLILDSKVSLTAYSRLVNATDEPTRALALKQHLTSVRTHIKELSSKNYPEVVPNAFNYVLLFFPNEGAYIEALQAAPELLEESQRHNVLLTSPTNLIMSIKLCYYLWQRDRQSKNLEQIVRECTDLYHKFVSFMSLFIQIDKSLEKAKERYDEAYRVLASGRGNITRRLDQLRRLGVTTNKELPESVLEDSARGEEAFSITSMRDADEDDEINEKLANELDEHESLHSLASLYPAELEESLNEAQQDDELQGELEEKPAAAPAPVIAALAPSTLFAPQSEVLAADALPIESRPADSHPVKTAPALVAPIAPSIEAPVKAAPVVESAPAIVPTSFPASSAPQPTPTANSESSSLAEPHHNLSEALQGLRTRRRRETELSSPRLTTASTPHHSASSAETPRHMRIEDSVSERRARIEEIVATHANRLPASSGGDSTLLRRESEANRARRARREQRLAEIDRRFTQAPSPAPAPVQPSAATAEAESAAFPSLRENLIAEAQRRFENK